MAIIFYRQDGPHGWMSNFYDKEPLVIDGEPWPSVEHHFQAQKFPNHKEIQEEIRAAEWAGVTKKIVNKYEDLCGWSHWDLVRDDVMLRALRAKFASSPRLRQALLETGEEELIEHTNLDSYWADGGDGSGLNTLGRLLMQVRSELRTDPSGSPSVS